MCGREEGTLPKGMSLIALQVYSNHCPYYCITLFPPLPLSRSPTTASSPLLVLTLSQTIGTRCRRGDDANLVCHHRPLRFRKSPIPHCSTESFGALWRGRTKKPRSKEGALDRRHPHPHPYTPPQPPLPSPPPPLRLTPKSLFLLLVFTQGTHSLASSFAPSIRWDLSQ